MDWCWHLMARRCRRDCRTIRTPSSYWRSTAQVRYVWHVLTTDSCMILISILSLYSSIGLFVYQSFFFFASLTSYSFICGVLKFHFLSYRSAAILFLLCYFFCFSYSTSPSLLHSHHSYTAIAHLPPSNSFFRFYWCHIFLFSINIPFLSFHHFIRGLQMLFAYI